MTDAQSEGDVLTVHKLNYQIRGMFPDDASRNYTYYQMYYHLTRLGFKWSRIRRTIKSGRSKPYVLQWLKDYCTRRVARMNTKSPGVVDVFLDECWLYKDTGGLYSWHTGDRHWHKAPPVQGGALRQCWAPACHPLPRITAVNDYKAVMQMIGYKVNTPNGKFGVLVPIVRKVVNGRFEFDLWWEAVKVCRPSPPAH